MSVTIIFIVLSLIGLEPVKHTRSFMSRMPVLQHLVTTDQEREFERIEIDYLNEIERYQTEINRLSQDLAASEAEITQLEQQITELNNELSAYMFELEDQMTREERTSMLVTTYQEMAPASAANILVSATDDIALPILRGVNAEQRSAILSAMTAEDAARMTELLLN